MTVFRLALAATLCVSASAHAGFRSCDMESEFDLRIQPELLTFSRSDGSPARIEMGRGRISVDGTELALSSADRARVAQYEDEVRALVPEVKAIALDAVGIASEALLQVATTFGGDKSDAAADRLRERGAALRREIESSDASEDWNERQFESAIEALVSEVVPILVGDIAATAVTAALSGDEKAVADIEARARDMERAIEASVERRAEALEARAEGLCRRLHGLEALETSIEAPLPQGGRLDLFRLEG